MKANPEPRSSFWGERAAVPLSSLTRGLAVVWVLVTGVSPVPAAEPQVQATTQSAPISESGKLADFRTSGQFNEQILIYRIEPGVNVYLNAPPAAGFDPARPTRLVIFALPNGNTIGQTIGKRLRPGVDWHFGIQHIGAQTRRLREVIRDQNIVLACIEADGRSWPAWRAKHADSGRIIGQVIDSIAGRLKGTQTSITLTGHSGGGSFTFGYLNSVDRISGRIDRIAFLDSNYAYSDEQKHGDKLIAWLRSSPRNHLVVIAYDDRNIMLDGKRVVSPTGGTYRRTLDMLARFRKEMLLSESPVVQIGSDTPPPTTGPAAALAVSKRYQGMDGQVDIILVENPQNKILHTVLVGEMSGFIHALTSGTPYENKAAVFGGPVTYDKWIQAD